MKALSIRQPWAWLIISGHKDIENRTWTPSQSPPITIAIHAAQKLDKEGYARVKEIFPEIDLPSPDQFLLGGIIGLVEYRGWVANSPSPWFSGPKGWILSNPRKIAFVPCRGRLGLFDVDISPVNDKLHFEP